MALKEQLTEDFNEIYWRFKRDRPLVEEMVDAALRRFKQHNNKSGANPPS